MFLRHIPPVRKVCKWFVYHFKLDYTIGKTGRDVSLNLQGLEKWLCLWFGKSLVYQGLPWWFLDFLMVQKPCEFNRKCSQCFEFGSFFFFPGRILPDDARQGCDLQFQSALQSHREHRCSTVKGLTQSRAVLDNLPPLFQRWTAGTEFRCLTYVCKTFTTKLHLKFLKDLCCIFNLYCQFI